MGCAAGIEEEAILIETVSSSCRPVQKSQNV